MVTNLYWVCLVDEDYGYFVFANSANKARSLCTYFNYENEEYIQLRAYLLVKGVMVKCECENAIVDMQEHPLYYSVQELGYGFREDEENDW